MDESQEQQAQNDSVAEESNVPTPPVDETNTSVEETEVEDVSQDTSAGETDTTERKPTRAERRIRDLAEENKRLREGAYQPTPQAPSLQPFDVRQYADTDGNLDVDMANQAYSQDVVQKANAIASLQTQQGIAQLRAEMTLEKDIDVVTAQNPELQENSPEYNPVLEAKIEKAYKERAFRNGQFDPSVRLADVANDYLEVARAAATKSSAEIKNAVAKQADETSLRPGGKATQEQDPSSMSADDYVKWAQAKFGSVRA